MFSRTNNSFVSSAEKGKAGHLQYYIVIRIEEESGELNISSLINLQSSLKSLIVFVLDFSDLVIPERSRKYPNQVLIQS